MAVAELGTAQHVGKGCCWGPGARGMLRHRCGTASSASTSGLRRWRASLVRCGSVLCVPSTEGNKMVLLFIIIILLLVNTILLRQIILQAAAWLYSAQVGAAQDTCTQPPPISSSWRGGNLYELLPQSLRKRRPRMGGGLTAALGDLRATAGMTEPSSSQGWMWPCHPALVPSPSSPEPPLQPARLAATRCVNWHSPNQPKPTPPKKNAPRG